MKPLNTLIFLLIFSTFILLGFLVSEFTGKVILERVPANLTKVIDGDTIDTDIGRVRLLGINTPEKKQPYYEEARSFLQQYEGKRVELEMHEKDKYQRTLAYLFYNNQLINSEILKKGLANLYVYEKDEHYPELEKAEASARADNLGIWKKSRNFGCINIIEFQPIDSEKENETLVFGNACAVNLSITLKDNANHIYQKNISANSKLTMHFKDIFNDNGDSLILRDENGLVLFYRY